MNLEFWIRLGLDAARFLYEILRDCSKRFAKDRTDQVPRTRKTATLPGSGLLKLS